jgi:hypothetical protein
MEDYLIFNVYGRQPHFLVKWKLTLIFWKIKEEINLLANGRGPQIVGKLKTISIVWQMEYDLNLLVNER